MRNSSKIEGKEEVPSPITLPPFNAQLQANLCQRVNVIIGDHSKMEQTEHLLERVTLWLMQTTDASDLYKQSISLRNGMVSLMKVTQYSTLPGSEVINL